MPPESKPVAQKPVHEGLHRNKACATGLVLGAVGTVLVAVSIPLCHTVMAESPFFPIFADVLFPAITVTGIFVFLYGMRHEVRQRLGGPLQRRRTLAVMAGALVPLVLLGIAAGDALHFSESQPFCAKTCHVALEPQDVAGLRSPHARVRCADCHVGRGLRAYVRSKIGGLRELYTMVLGTYARPIPAPVQNMRPARETCGDCHWAEEHFGARLVQRPYFRYDEQNTAEQISLLVKTGGGLPRGEGIHFKMFIDKQIAFVAEDSQRQRIPWVKATSKDGTSVEYFSTERKMAPEKIATMPGRTVDCVDCHNRTGHDFEPPDLAVDHALASDAISPTLPWIKKVAVEAVGKRYAGGVEAREGIRREIMAYYQKNLPAITAARAADIARAAEAAFAIWASSVFPRMNVDSTTYPSNVSHTSWPGCFRCHDGKHVSPGGQVLPSDCALCHTLPQRAKPSPLGEMITSSGDDWHPWQIGTKHLAVKKHAEILCHECHSAGGRPKTECEDCHR